LKYNKRTPMQLNEVKRLIVGEQGNDIDASARNQNPKTGNCQLETANPENCLLNSKIQAQPQAKAVESLNSQLSRIEARDAVSMAEKATEQTVRHPG
jgi:pyruvate/2-oxoglutarate/acetoin dehydrogenase E1 component